VVGSAQTLGPKRIHPRVHSFRKYSPWRYTVASTLIIVDPDIQSGAPVFAGTRVPVQNLFDYLEEGDSLDVFLKQFPSVTREQAVAVLEKARMSLVADAHPA
jgi:uncharacterized protein (DUF433 family)